MPRGRMLDKEAISQSKKLSELSNDTGRLIYTWLLAHLDAEGRFSADPAIIKGIVFPRIKKMTVNKIEKYLNEMSIKKLLILYQADGDKYLQYIKFREYQNLDKNREAPSKIPPPKKENIINSGVNPIKSDLVPPSEVKLREDKISKETYAEFVLMTKEEHKKLIDKYGEKNTDKFIEKLNNTKGANKKLKYDSDYFAILKWVVEAVIGEDKKKELEKDYKLIRQKERDYEKEKKNYENKPIPPEIKEHIKKMKLKSYGKE